MDINNRLKLLREKLNLTTRAVGAAINLSGGSITNMEKGTRNLTDRTISDICRVFDVNEDWLRYGSEPMFRPKKTIDNDLAERIADLIQTDDDLTKAFIVELLKLTPDEREIVKRMLENIKEYI